MLLIAIVIALLALPAALIDLRLAILLVLLATLLTVLGLFSGRSVIAGGVAIALIVSGCALAAFEWWDLRSPRRTESPDVAAYSRAGEDREVLLPLTVGLGDVKRLALLEFEEGQDRVYRGFEPQFLDRGHESGYRVIAYRTDGYVDIYDDLALTAEPDVTSAVTGKGRRGYSHTDLGDPTIGRDEHGRATIRFAFTDLAGRSVVCNIRETTTQRSVPLNLLAPIGASSAEPDHFPLYLMSDFEFLRLSGTTFDLTIDGEHPRLQDFPVPVPIQGQRRSFSKYTLDSEIISLFPTDEAGLHRVRTTGDAYRDGDVTYLFAGGALERILVGATEIVYTPPLDVSTEGRGRFVVTSYPDLGTLEGPYEVTGDGTTGDLSLSVDSVTVPRQRGLVYRLVVSDASVFGTWPRNYSFRATFDLREDAVHEDNVQAHWRNSDPLE